MHPARPNNATARIVDEGIALLARATKHEAACYMEKHGVAFRVMVRVLAPDGIRRVATSPAEQPGKIRI